MELIVLNSLIAALDVTTVLYWTGIVLKVAVALGFVIFVHELGHFLVARACGVRCDKFMVGFDIGGYKLSRKWGETEYGIGILPLGGYVKMFGQDDDPARIAEQMQKSQVNAASADGVEVTGPNGEKFFVDRRSYLGKSVPQRMAIISAGVIMNIIFAFIFAVIAFGIGVPYMPSIVSEAVPGSPAWQAGIEPGDEIVRLGDRENPSFNQLRGGVMLGDLERGIPAVVRRAEDDRLENLVLRPERDTGLARVGIAPPMSLTLAERQPTLKHSPASRATVLATGQDTAAERDENATKFAGGDEIVRVNDVPVTSYRELVALLARQPDEPLRVAVVRQEKPAGRESDAAAADASRELVFEVPPQPARSLGMVLEMGPITAIQAGSAAEAAGFEVGDVIEAINGEPLNGSSRWEPFTLADRLLDAARAGEEVTFTIHRSAEQVGTDRDAITVENGAGTQRVEIAVTPRLPTTYHALPSPETPMAIASLGIAYQIENRVVAVSPDGPAAKAGIRVGDRLTAARFIPPKGEQELEELKSLPLSSEQPNVPRVFLALQVMPPGTEVEFTVERESAAEPQQVKLVPATFDDVFLAERGFVLQPVERIRLAETFGQQLQYGFEETTEALGLIFRFLQKLGTQVPVTALGGPVTIARVAGLTAAEGTATFLIFLTVLSANLAVINFLPIPLLDGGHMVFLAYEGIRGRPAPEKLVVAMHAAGFLFIVSLMVFVLFLDFGWIPRNL